MKFKLLAAILFFGGLLSFYSSAQAMVTQVSGQNKGEVGQSSLANLSFTNSVTSGNQIIVVVQAYNNSAPTINSPTKASGTATIGAFAQDATYQNNSGSDYFKISVFRAPVTGSGTLTLGFSGTFAYSLAAINEYSGMDASPVDGSAVTNTGTSNTESSGNITTTTGGLVLMSSTELSTGNFTYTQSDANIYSVSTGASSFTGQVQQKIIAGAGTYNLTAGTGNSWFWVALAVPYKAAVGGGGGDTTAPSVPTGLSATAISSSAINLSWTASTDAVGVTGYKIFRAGTQVGTSATNSYSDTGLSPSTSYSYTVSAYDAAGNNSSQSSSASATTQASGSTINGSYSTTFPATENPISESGAWVNGKATGLNWNNVRTTQGLAFGTQPGTGAPPYDDSIAVLTGTWTADQSAQGTVRIVNSSSAGQREVEILLRANVSPNSITGYEILCNVVPGAGYGIQVVRWNGPLNSFTYLNNTPALNCVNGDILKATVSGNPATINVYRNNLTTPILTTTDTNPNPYTSGNPGIGFWNQSATASDFGFSAFSATNGAGGGGGDTTAPSVPTGLSATAISSSQINLSWTASTDAVGVTGYKIFRAGIQIGTSATNSYSDSGLSPSTSYSYTVSAYDAAGNNSSQSSSASATTQAQQTGSTVTAASCSQTDVQSAINSASDGYTVNVPTGSCAWASTVNISGKGIHLKGSGSTNISGTVTKINLVKDSTHIVEISGFTFSGGIQHIFVSGAWTARPFIVHDVTFNLNGTQALRVETNGGLIYNSTFNGNNNYDDQAVQHKLTGSSSGSWTTADTMGMRDSTGEKNLYIEDSVFNNLPLQGFDFDENSRIVVRYSTFTNSAITSHGLSTGPASLRHFEIYNNRFIWNPRPTSCTALGSAYPMDYFVFIRGGTGLLYGNNFDNINSCYTGDKSEVKFQEQQLRRVSGYTSCPTVYPALQQLGQSHNGTNYVTDPIYIWGNIGESGQNGNSATASDYESDDCGNGTTMVPQFWQSGRDYVNNGTQKPAYSAYTYPHPLHTGITPPPADTTAPSVPTGLSATAISTSQINLSWNASTDNIGVTGYRIYRGGVLVGTTITNNYNDNGLNPSTLYSYTVSAYDAAGNSSSQSASSSATTQSGTPIAGDLNLDHIVNALDYSLLNSKWLQTFSAYDLQADGLINSLDFAILSSNWGKVW